MDKLSLLVLIGLWVCVRQVAHALDVTTGLGFIAVTLVVMGIPVFLWCRYVLRPGRGGRR